MDILRFSFLVVNRHRVCLEKKLLQKLGSTAVSYIYVLAIGQVLDPFYNATTIFFSMKKIVEKCCPKTGIIFFQCRPEVYVLPPIHSQSMVSIKPIEQPFRTLWMRSKWSLMSFPICYVCLVLLAILFSSQLYTTLMPPSMAMPKCHIATTTA